VQFRRGADSKACFVWKPQTGHDQRPSGIFSKVQLLIS
jgi:hypothetical protein